MGATTILALTVLFSLIGLQSRRAIDWAMLRPYLVARRSRYHGLVTSGFVHADLGHLLFNLITFYSFGFALERTLGTASFVTLYALGLLISNIGTTVKHRDDPNYASLGASGAILAVLFASILYFPQQRMFILPLPIPIPAPLFAIGYLALSYYWSRHSKDRINHDAHLGGALTGLTFVAVTNPDRYRALLDSLMG